MRKAYAIMMAIVISLMSVTFASAEETDPRGANPGVGRDLAAVQVEEAETPLVKNGRNEDSGAIYIKWSEDATADYNTNTASIYYKNSGKSNMIVQVELTMFDDQVYKYFGTTFKSADELDDLALAGYVAMQSGITNRKQKDALFTKGIVQDKSIPYPLSFDELIDVLVQNNYLQYSREDWLSLNEGKIKDLCEYEKLMIAQFGDYTFNTGDYLSLGTTGMIPPGYEISVLQLDAFGDGYILPMGEYNAILHVKGYDVSKDDYSDVTIDMPVTLRVVDSLSEEEAASRGLTLAKQPS